MTIARHFLSGEEQLTAARIIESAGLIKRNGANWHSRALTPYMKMLGFGTAELMRIDGKTGKYYEFDAEKLSALVQRFSDDDDLIEKMCNRVTVVTVVTEAPSFFEKEENKENVTVTGTLYKDGYNGYTVTPVTDVTDQKEGFDPKKNLTPVDYIEVSFLKDCAALVGPGGETFGPFVHGAVVRLPPVLVRALVKKGFVYEVGL